MSETTYSDQKLCADLQGAIGAALYFLEVRNDPAGAAQILRDAQERSVEAYLTAHGPIYDGTQTLDRAFALDTPGES